MQDAGEPGIAGAVVSLDDNNLTASDEQGFYSPLLRREV